MNIPFYEDIAVLFLSELVLLKNSRPVPVSEIAEKHKISPLFLKKIARMLRRSGFITSKEGVNGGYNLSVDPRYTTLWDVYKAVDQSRYSFETQVDLLYSSCPIKKSCLPQIIRKSIRTSIQASLQSITLNSLTDSL